MTARGGTSLPADADIEEWRGKGYASIVLPHQAYSDPVKLPEAVQLSKDGMASIISASHATAEAQLQLLDDVCKFKRALTQPTRDLWEWLAGQLDSAQTPASGYPRMRLPALSLELLEANADDTAMQQAKALARQAAADMLRVDAVDAYALARPAALEGKTYTILDMQDLYFERAARHLET